ncbi:MAG: GNAT family N-acetyltransferase [Gammaproteobacteria bacterium]|nr:GNAT family N-acetyltransferase [Gammaproteobacteria bacterium]
MTSTITFRSATKADLVEILNFTKDKTELFYFFPSATFPLTLEQLEKQLSDRHESTVMIENNSLKKNLIIGFANFYNVKNRNIGFIGNVIIKSEKRKRGFGKQLVQTMIKSGFEQLNLKEVHLSCYKQNTSALSFYKHIGFKPYATEIRKDINNAPTELIHLKVKKSN